MGEGFFNPSPNSIRNAKACWIDLSEGNKLGKVACNFDMHLKDFSKGILLEIPKQNRSSEAISARKILETIEHATYSIKYCKASLLMCSDTQGEVAFQTLGPFTFTR